MTGMRALLVEALAGEGHARVYDAQSGNDSFLVDEVLNDLRPRSFSPSSSRSINWTGRPSRPLMR